MGKGWEKRGVSDGNVRFTTVRSGAVVHTARKAAERRTAPDEFGWRRVTSENPGDVRGCRGSGKGAQGRTPAGIRSGECHGARTHVPVDVALVQPEPLREHHRHGRYRRTRQVGLSTIGERGNVVGGAVMTVTSSRNAPPNQASDAGHRHPEPSTRPR